MLTNDKNNQLLEMTPIADTFACGIGRIEFLVGNLVRITFFTSHAADDGGAALRTIAARLILPVAAIPGGMSRIEQVIEAIGQLSGS